MQAKTNPRYLMTDRYHQGGLYNFCPCGQNERLRIQRGLIPFFQSLRMERHYSNSKSKRYHRWLVFGSSTYYLYASVTEILAA